MRHLQQDQPLFREVTRKGCESLGGPGGKASEWQGKAVGKAMVADARVPPPTPGGSEVVLRASLCTSRQERLPFAVSALLLGGQRGGAESACICLCIAFAQRSSIILGDAFCSLTAPLRTRKPAERCLGSCPSSRSSPGSKQRGGQHGPRSPRHHSVLRLRPLKLSASGASLPPPAPNHETQWRASLSLKVNCCSERGTWAGREAGPRGPSLRTQRRQQACEGSLWWVVLLWKQKHFFLTL